MSAYDYKDTGRCPHCECDLRDPKNEGYWRTIGVEIQGVYDGTLFWQCPDCDGRWHRWDEKTWARLYNEAEKYVGQNPGTPEPS